MSGAQAVQRQQEPSAGLLLLEKWFAARCDGNWEQHYGVRIDSLDNPGWTLEIDLDGTPAQSRCLARTMIQRGENDWINFWVADKRFHARMGVGNLDEAIGIFVGWFDKSI
jgi:hypothetical protein